MPSKHNPLHYLRQHNCPQPVYFSGVTPDVKIFDALRRITPGKGGELRLTDAIELLIQEGEPVHVVVHSGTRHDLGNPGGYIPANVEFGLRSMVYGPALYTQLKKIIADYEAEKGLS